MPMPEFDTLLHANGGSFKKRKPEEDEPASPGTQARKSRRKGIPYRSPSSLLDILPNLDMHTRLMCNACSDDDADIPLDQLEELLSGGLEFRFPKRNLFSILPNNAATTITAVARSTGSTTKKANHNNNNNSGSNNNSNNQKKQTANNNNNNSSSSNGGTRRGRPMPSYKEYEDVDSDETEESQYDDYNDDDDDDDNDDDDSSSSSSSDVPSSPGSPSPRSSRRAQQAAAAFTTSTTTTTTTINNNNNNKRKKSGGGNQQQQQQQQSRTQRKILGSDEEGDAAAIMTGYATISTPVAMRRHFQPKNKAGLAGCANSGCQSGGSTVRLWRKGWIDPETREHVLLCNACGLRFAKNMFCPCCRYIYTKNEIEKSGDKWIRCIGCRMNHHKTCVMPADGTEPSPKSFMCQKCTTRGHSTRGAEEASSPTRGSPIIDMEENKESSGSNMGGGSDNDASHRMMESDENRSHEE